MGKDLFWETREGGGASFGITCITPVVVVFHVIKTYETNASDLIYRCLFVANKIDNNLFIKLLQPTTVKDKDNVRATFIGLYGNEMDSSCPNSTSENRLLHRKGGSLNFFKRKYDYLKTPIPNDGLDGSRKNVIELGKIGMVFNTYGVKMDKIRKSAMPFAHQQGTSSKYSILQKCDQDDAASVKKYVKQTKTFHSNMTPLVSKNPREVFLNYRDLDTMILALLTTVKTLAMKQRCFWVQVHQT
ncbi:Hypothetical predicted protein [Olea europaea subsp. europaea]|uniref:Uncharacterized protein n=1 Tax=Olea europaea subsp. europaea TaxID=158383 RepID=A0A8S0TSQ7_OLEEU|nr:Hypothetical predicted protein [Olea europaea subsp. europaea]